MSVRLKRVLSFILSVVMILSCMSAMSFLTFAYSEGDFTYEIYDGEARITGFNSNYVGTVTIPDTLGGYPVTEIDGYYDVGYDWYESYGAFSDCQMITKVVIPDSVKIIEDAAFYNCASLSTVDLGNGVESIGEYAFANCIALKEMHIPASVSSIGKGAFDECTRLSAFTVEENSMYFSAQDGVLFSSDMTTLVRFPIRKDAPEYIVPTSVKTISSYAFDSCSKVTRIILPEGMTEISDCAFYGAYNVTNISMPSTLQSIGADAFGECPLLTSVNLPEGLPSIGAYAFCGASIDAINIPASVQSIDDWAFYGSHIRTINISYGVQSIGESAFGCSELVDVYIPDSVKTIGAGAFHECTSLRSVRLPDGLTRIEDSLFSSCASLRSITIPSSVIYVGDYAFQACYSLNNIIIPENVMYIGLYAFSDYWDYVWWTPTITIMNPDCGIYNSEYTIIPNATIIGYKDSTAEIYAERYRREFRDIESVGIPEEDSTGYPEYPTYPEEDSTIYPEYPTYPEEDSTEYPDYPEYPTYPEEDSTEYPDYPEYPTYPEEDSTEYPDYPEYPTYPEEDSTEYPDYPDYPEIRLGDVNFDGKITASDARLVLRVAAKLDVFIGDQAVAADVNRDMHITSRDARTVLRVSAKLEVLDNNGMGAPSEELNEVHAEEFSIHASVNYDFSDSSTYDRIEYDVYCNDPYEFENGMFSIDYDEEKLSVNNVYGYADMSAVNYDSDDVSLGFAYIETKGNYYGSDTVFTVTFDVLEPLSSDEDMPIVYLNEYNNFVGKVKLDVDYDPYDFFIDPTKCGENLTWSFFDGVLTISGTGDMYNTRMPWNDIKSQIRKVVLEPGVTSVGNSAFAYCENLETVEISPSVTTIGHYAFSYCSKLSLIDLSNVKVLGDGSFSSTPLTYVDLSSLEISGWGAFENCTHIRNVVLSFIDNENINMHYMGLAYAAFIKTVTVNSGKIADFAFGQEDAFDGGLNHLDNMGRIVLKDGVVSVGDFAFYKCDSLTYVDIASTVENIGDCAFVGCPSLARIYIRNSECDIFDDEMTIPERTIIYGYRNSTAQAYAEKYDREFRALDSCSHTATKLVGAIDATCIGSGFSGDLTCTVCEEIISHGNIVSPAGHSYGEWVIESEPDCLNSGLKSKTCASCGEISAVEMAVLAHDDYDGDRICDNCGTTISSDSQPDDDNGDSSSSAISGFLKSITDFFRRIFEWITSLFGIA